MSCRGLAIRSSSQRVVRKPQPSRDQLGATADPLDVLPGLVVAQLGRARQSMDRLLTRPPELGGPLGDELLEPLVVCLVLDLEATAAQRVRDPDVHLAVAERLHDVAVRSECQRGLGELRVVGPADHHDGDVGATLDHVADELQAGLTRQVDVAEDELERAGGQLGARLGRIAGDGRHVALVRHEPAERLAHARLVVNDEDARQLPSQGVRAHGRAALAQLPPGRRA